MKFIQSENSPPTEQKTYLFHLLQKKLNNLLKMGGLLEHSRNLGRSLETLALRADSKASRSLKLGHCLDHDRHLVEFILAKKVPLFRCCFQCTPRSPNIRNVIRFKFRSFVAKISLFSGKLFIIYWNFLIRKVFLKDF